MTLALAAPPYEGTLPLEAETGPPTVAKPAEPAPLTGRDLQDAVRDALQKWVHPDDAEANQAAIRFLALNQQLLRDTELARSQRSLLLKKVRNRLERLKDQIARRNARLKADGLDKLPVTVAQIQEKAIVIAQMMGMGGMPMGGMAGMPMGGMGAAGIGMGMGGAGGFGAGRADLGEDLVDLIQTTIAPDSWEVNGGPGTIRYWRNGMSLIIRQTDEIHGDIDDLLRQLERANR